MKRYVFLLALLVLLAGCTIAQTKQRYSCNGADMATLQDAGTSHLYAVAFTLDATEGAEGAGGIAYYEKDVLQRLSIGFYGSMQKTEMEYTFLDEHAYVVDIEEYVYTEPLTIHGASVMHTRLFMCNDAPLGTARSEHLQSIREALSNARMRLQG